jgi:hypothetical protein
VKYLFLAIARFAILLKKLKIEWLQNSRECQFLVVPAARSLCRTCTKVPGPKPRRCEPWAQSKAAELGPAASWCLADQLNRRNGSLERDEFRLRRNLRFRNSWRTPLV